MSASVTPAAYRHMHVLCGYIASWTPGMPSVSCASLLLAQKDGLGRGHTHRSPTRPIPKQSFSPFSPRMETQGRLSEALATAKRIGPSFLPSIHRERVWVQRLQLRMTVLRRLPASLRGRRICTEYRALIDQKAISTCSRKATFGPMAHPT
ncbi:hypothetical protein LZ30DRAFT_456942 [Colletotrichum cereale]|nr:hypothetical protein LZ30DRAFT_456942 [Colletotrichum cereale]